jgi:hypothetical protein
MGGRRLETTEARQQQITDAALKVIGVALKKLCAGNNS